VSESYVTEIIEFVIVVMPVSAAATHTVCPRHVIKVIA